MDWIDDTIMSRKEAARWYEVDEYVDTFGTSYSQINNFCEVWVFVASYLKVVISSIKFIFNYTNLK